MAKSDNLRQAKANKKDEFYTQFNDIQNELQHYQRHFKDEVIYCNCDDPLASNFMAYFLIFFEQLGIKKLISTCYCSINFSQASKNDSDKKACKIEVDAQNLPYFKKYSELLSLSLSLVA